MLISTLLEAALTNTNMILTTNILTLHKIHQTLITLKLSLKLLPQTISKLINYNYNNNNINSKCGNNNNKTTTINSFINNNTNTISIKEIFNIIMSLKNNKCMYIPCTNNKRTIRIYNININNSNNNIHYITNNIKTFLPTKFLQNINSFNNLSQNQVEKM